ncbi:hypothetical protein [Duganella violaceipulchra]|uniref:Uncharacterized protein n=1 Tax=Duganella violaceipulchra TaxID=2849652 RepID=A0AA41LB88_9BURK|nr:hypothetical protein [Duganella violaceicalia]MBV6325060.1 hypothetical protein [Duganella violaceicalia]MCP2010572.1 hypothetical protein [Duganella violaceicalia]
MRRASMLLLLGCAGLAQAAAPALVRSLAVQGKSTDGKPVPAGDIVMPLVQAGDPALSAKINDKLFLAQFGVLSPKTPGKSVGAADGIALDGVSTQSYAVGRNDGRILTIAFNSEFCGAYCETSRQYYSFDMGSGRSVQAEDIFTVAGMRELARQMRKQRLAAYRNEAAQRKAALDALRKEKKASKDDLDDLEQRVALNSECASKESQLAKQSDADLLAAFRTYQLEAAAQKYNIYSERCSSHAEQALDDVGTVKLALSYAELSPQLNDYGKALLTGTGAVPPAGGYFGQVLHGRLGTMAVTMTLKKDGDGGVEGTYFYDKFRQPIALDGTERDGKLVLNERSGDKVSATLQLGWSEAAHALQGSWTGKKELAVSLAP